MGAELTLRVTEVANSGDVLTNKSYVHIYLACTTNSGTWSHDGKTEGYIRLDGVQIANLNGAWVDMNTTTRIYEADYEVTHNSDGTRSIVVDAGFNLNTTYTGWVYASQALTITPIPRASTLKVPAVITLGAANQMAIYSVADPFEHTLLYTLGNASGEVCNRVAGGALTWTPDIELCRQITDGEKRDGALTLITYSDGGENSKEIGRESYPFTAYVSSDVKPTVKSITCTPVNDNGTLHRWGVYVKGKTKVQFSVEAEKAYGSSVNKCAFSCAGQTVNAFSGTTGVLATAGDFTPQANVTDTRGRSSGVAYGSAVTVYDYTVPTIGSSYAIRSNSSGTADESGTYVAVMCSAGCAPVGGRNKVTVRVRTRPVNGSWGSYTTLTNGVQMVLSGYSEKTSYEVELSATDDLGETKTVLYTIPTEAITFMLSDGGERASFGKYPEETGLDMGWDIHMNGNKIRGLGDSLDLGDAVAAGKANRGASVQVEANLTTAGWYRVGKISPFDGHSSSVAQIAFGGVWQSNMPTVAIINALMMRGTAKLYRQNLLVSEHQIKEIRLHRDESRNAHYIDVYYAMDNENLVSINVNVLQGVFASYGLQALDVSSLEPVAVMVIPDASDSDEDLDHANRRDNPHVVTSEQVGAVPVGRTVNGKALSSDITITAEDVGAVPTSRTVNGKPLSANISLSAADVGARPSTWTPSASDVGATPASHASNKSNPHGVTKSQVGLGNVDNTSDAAMLLKCWPVGSIYIAYNHTSPASLFGGTWARIENAFLWGVGSSASIGATGGEQTHTLTEAEMPKHKHDRIRYYGNTGWTVGDNTGLGGRETDSNSQCAGNMTSNNTISHWVTNSAGSSAAHNNMPPYIQVSIWRRTA